MFTDRAQAVIDRAKDHAFSSGCTKLDLPSVLAAVGERPEASVLLAECLALTPRALRAACPRRPEPMSCPGKLWPSEPLQRALASAATLAAEVPDRLHPGLVAVGHLVCALAASPEAARLLKVAAMSPSAGAARLAAWYEREAQDPGLEELARRVRQMRSGLLAQVFGQDHAVEAFVEGLFNAEVAAAADSQHRAPRGVFVFAGPPGVGKTYLAELGAACLARPLGRFDMSAYAGEHSLSSLAGLSRAYRGAQPGLLTGFVEKNPNAVLLFDEIERAHVEAIGLFLQVLDAGTLEDRYHRGSVSFRDTTIIFTTNAGRKLYDHPNESGVHAANSAFHRQTILDALAGESDPRSGRPLFPPAICSRLASGCPVLFNHLGVNELERIAQAELDLWGDRLERQYYKRTTFDGLVAMSLVLREGPRADARALRSQAQSFVKTELLRFCQLFQTDRLDQALGEVDTIHFALEEPQGELSAEVRDLFEPQGRPRVLLVAAAGIAELYPQHIGEVDWLVADTAADALRLLADQDVDLVLLDLWLGPSMEPTAGRASWPQPFDHTPAAARNLDEGQEILRRIRERLPHLPVYLLSLAPTPDARGSIDEELFLACVRAGGARGMIVSRFVDAACPDWRRWRDVAAADLVETCRRLHRETAAERLARQGKLLAEALETARFGEPRANDPRLIERAAFHEAGHAVLYWLSGWWAAYVTIVARPSQGGCMAHCAPEAEQGLQTVEDELARIRLALGGRAAEIVRYGDLRGLSSGVAGDLDDARAIARRLIRDYGMDPRLGLCPTDEQVAARTGEILDEQMAEAIRLLRANRRHLDGVAEALVRKERLGSDDLKRILPAMPAPRSRT